MHTRAFIVLILLLFGRGAPAMNPADPRPTGGRSLAAQVSDAFEKKDFSGALDLLRRQLSENPRDPFVAY
ncbi:MAG: hypothetical protein JNK58_12760, partial [Phycisphaerae bacterium]|nr:hypothetical protein [Phycisphaerae bacterium]